MVQEDGRGNVHDEPRSGQPPLITNYQVTAVDVEVHEDRIFTISTLSMICPQVSRSVPYNILFESLHFRIVHRMGIKPLTENHKLKGWDSTLTY